MDYLDSSFAKLKYIDTLTPTNSRDQFYLNSCTDLQVLDCIQKLALLN